MGSTQSQELLKCARGHHGEEAALEILQAHSSGVGKYTLNSSFKDDQGNSILHFACANGHAKLVDALLERGTAHEPNNKGAYPIHSAAYKGHKDVLKKLIDHGIDVNLKTKHGVTAIMIACSHSHIDCVVFLTAQYKAIEVDIPDDTLIYAASKTSPEVVGILLKVGEFLNECDDSGFTALMAASMAGNLDVVNFLLSYKEQRIVPNKADCEGRTALHWAYTSESENKDEIIKALLLAGCDEDKLAKNGKTPSEFSAPKPGKRRRESGILNSPVKKRNRASNVSVDE